MKLVGTDIRAINVLNTANARLAIEAFALGHGESKDIELVLYPESILKGLEIFAVRGDVKITILDDIQAKAKEKSDVVTKTTVKNEKGDLNEHVVYDPAKASTDRLITVSEIEVDTKAVEVSGDTIDREDAERFLEKHWKTVEKELELMTSVANLKKLLVVAEDLGMSGNKKHELIEDRIEALK